VVFVRGPGADIMQEYLQQAVLNGPLEDGGFKIRLQDSREQAEYIKPHKTILALSTRDDKQNDGRLILA
jgi:hypothetical protein